MSKSNKKIKGEKATRAHLLEVGRFYGFEGELKKILDKYDRLLLNCTNEQERKAIAHMGIIEIDRMLGAGQSILSSNGEVIINNTPTLLDKESSFVTNHTQHLMEEKNGSSGQ